METCLAVLSRQAGGQHQRFGGHRFHAIPVYQGDGKTLNGLLDAGDEGEGPRLQPQGMKFIDETAGVFRAGALFGLHQNIVILGCCLAVLPYLLGAVYLQKSHKQCPLWLSASAILIPSIVEKIAIYLFGAYLYNLSPINVLGVMEAIKSNASYTNFIKNQSAQNLINLSYFNWTYILCSIAISVLVILLLNQTKQKSNKG